MDTLAYYDAGMTTHTPRPYGVPREPIDQVKRKEAFLQRHPSVEISSPRQNETRAWKAIWDTEHGYDEINRFELQDLLNHLEAKFDAEQDG